MSNLSVQCFDTPPPGQNPYKPSKDVPGWFPGRSTSLVGIKTLSGSSFIAVLIFRAPTKAFFFKNEDGFRSPKNPTENIIKPNLKHKFTEKINASLVYTDTMFFTTKHCSINR